MKRYYLATIFFFLSLAGCRKALEEHPQSIAAEAFYNTPAEVEAGLAAIYGPLRDQNSLGALYQTQLECYADYMYGRGSHAVLNNYQGLDNTNITRVAGFWGFFYTSIRNANIIIQKAPLAKSVANPDKSKYIAEARFMRALDYFFLVRNWGGVPLRTETNIDSINLKRSAAADVFAFIVSDLQYAENNLPDVPRLTGTPSKWSAKTVLADVYMNMGQYSSARDEALAVIQSKKYSLVSVSAATDFDSKLYGADVTGSTEEIFYLKFARAPDLQGNYYPVYAFYPNSGYYPPGGFYTFYSDSVNNKVLAGWNRSDLRYSCNWYGQTFGLGNTTVLNRKFIDKGAVTAAGNDYPMYRYADLLMIYAEADARANNATTADAMEKLNMVHRRGYGKNPLTADPTVDFPLAGYPDLNSFINLLVKEEGYEDCSEGKRWLYLKRLGLAKQVIMDIKGIAVADKHLLWPIPTTEYNYNKAINPATDQNPGY
ncbi:MAG: RagB/SusD family nutrient uptake outer membrane protein [Bacteroidetes bacterium]|nr:RagB/SusD family nutrient uptake outer membrane protein [Bacteroidota bacterium]